MSRKLSSCFSRCGTLGEREDLLSDVGPTFAHCKIDIIR